MCILDTYKKPFPIVLLEIIIGINAIINSTKLDNGRIGSKTNPLQILIVIAET